MKELKIIILDAASIGDDIDFSVFGEFGKVEIYESTSPEEFTERAKDADVIVQNKYKLDKESLERAPAQTLVCQSATGFDNIDVEYCREHGIAVTNVPGYSTDCVAQLTFSMVLNLLMHIPTFNEYIRSGEYAESGIANKLTPQIHEIRGKTWGIVGLGNIGKKVAEIAKAFGCKVIACKRTPVPDYECTDLETLCREADIISLHTPLNDETRGLIGEKELSLMKKSAILINVARGAVTDEAAVAKAVLEGRIASFGCDVYSAEPFGRDHPFWDLLPLPNVCLTPHIAWGAYETRVRLIGEMLENIAAFLDGTRRNRVD